jgi:hypothetical protein
MPDKRDKLIEIGFKSINHFTIMNSLTYDLGRGRFLSFGSIDTPNEMLFLEQVENNEITDLICLRNYDYDGYTSIQDIINIISFFKQSRIEQV